MYRPLMRKTCTKDGLHLVFNYLITSKIIMHQRGETSQHILNLLSHSYFQWNFLADTKKQTVDRSRTSLNLWTKKARKNKSTRACYLKVSV